MNIGQLYSFSQQKNIYSNSLECNVISVTNLKIIVRNRNTLYIVQTYKAWNYSKNKIHCSLDTPKKKKHSQINIKSESLKKFWHETRRSPLIHRHRKHIGRRHKTNNPNWHRIRVKVTSRNWWNGKLLDVTDCNRYGLNKNWSFGSLSRCFGVFRSDKGTGTTLLGLRCCYGWYGYLFVLYCTLQIDCKQSLKLPTDYVTKRNKPKEIKEKIKSRYRYLYR